MRLQPRASLATPGIVHEVLRSPGQPLDTATRAYFEPRFGHDFSKVRVHADSQAAKSARAVDARAYTVGRHIVLGDGGQPSAQAGGARQLLAHELAHVVQQSRGGAVPEVTPTAPHEQDARAAAMAVEAGSPSVRIACATGVGLARSNGPPGNLADLTPAQIEAGIVDARREMDVVARTTADMLEHAGAPGGVAPATHRPVRARPELSDPLRRSRESAAAELRWIIQQGGPDTRTAEDLLDQLTAARQREADLIAERNRRQVAASEESRTPPSESHFKGPVSEAGRGGTKAEGTAAELETKVVGVEAKPVGLRARIGPAASLSGVVTAAQPPTRTGGGQLPPGSVFAQRPPSEMFARERSIIETKPSVIVADPALRGQVTKGTETIHVESGTGMARPPSPEGTETIHVESGTGMARPPSPGVAAGEIAIFVLPIVLDLVIGHLRHKLAESERDNIKRGWHVVVAPEVENAIQSLHQGWANNPETRPTEKTYLVVVYGITFEYQPHTRFWMPGGPVYLYKETTYLRSHTSTTPLDVRLYPPEKSTTSESMGDVPERQVFAVSIPVWPEPPSAIR